MMALTPAEKQKRYRERRKERAKSAPDLTPIKQDAFAALFKTIEEWPAAKRLPDDLGEIAHQLSFLGETLASIGYALPDFSKEYDPEWHEFGGWGTPDRGALGKAERMVGAFIDSAQALAEIINTFKLREIEAAKAEIAARDLSTPEAKRQAIADGVRLDKIERRLRKEYRRSFPAIDVKEE